MAKANFKLIKQDDEFQVQVFVCGEMIPARTYFTDDKQDAVETMAAMEREEEMIEQKKVEKKKSMIGQEFKSVEIWAGLNNRSMLLVEFNRMMDGTGNYSYWGQTRDEGRQVNYTGKAKSYAAAVEKAMAYITRNGLEIISSKEKIYIATGLDQFNNLTFELASQSENEYVNKPKEKEKEEMTETAIPAPEQIKLNDDGSISTESKIKALDLERKLGELASDASGLTHFIYYRKEPTFFARDSWVGDINEIVAKDYAPVIKVKAEDLERVYTIMQGDYWSPRGEARFLIRARELRHTSMSVGDLVYTLETGMWHEVDMVGFKQVGQDMPEEDAQEKEEIKYFITYPSQDKPLANQTKHDLLQQFPELKKLIAHFGEIRRLVIDTKDGESISILRQTIKVRG